MNRFFWIFLGFALVAHSSAFGQRLISANYCCDATPTVAAGQTIASTAVEATLVDAFAFTIAASVVTANAIGTVTVQGGNDRLIWFDVGSSSTFSSSSTTTVAITSDPHPYRYVRLSIRGSLGSFAPSVSLYGRKR